VLFYNAVEMKHFIVISLLKQTLVLVMLMNIKTLLEKVLSDVELAVVSSLRVVAV